MLLTETEKVVMWGRKKQNRILATEIRLSANKVSFNRRLVIEELPRASMWGRKKQNRILATEIRLSANKVSFNRTPCNRGITEG